jgi:hypothetical protein
VVLHHEVKGSSEHQSRLSTGVTGKVVTALELAGQQVGESATRLIRGELDRLLDIADCLEMKKPPGMGGFGVFALYF